jgi:glutathione synthase/RimK-type ligase-like ATP-grasp enzyme
MHSDLDFYAIDMAETEDGKIYVFEMNSEPGALFGIMTELYKRIYEDFYETELSQESIELLKKFKAEDSAQNTKQNPIWKLEK